MPGTALHDALTCGGLGSQNGCARLCQGMAVNGKPFFATVSHWWLTMVDNIHSGYQHWITVIENVEQWLINHVYVIECKIMIDNAE